MFLSRKGCTPASSTFLACRKSVKRINLLARASAKAISFRGALSSYKLKMLIEAQSHEPIQEKIR